MAGFVTTMDPGFAGSWADTPAAGVGPAAEVPAQEDTTNSNPAAETAHSSCSLVTDSFVAETPAVDTPVAETPEVDIPAAETPAVSAPGSVDPPLAATFELAVRPVIAELKTLLVSGPAGPQRTTNLQDEQPTDLAPCSVVLLLPYHTPVSRVNISNLQCTLHFACRTRRKALYLY